MNENIITAIILSNKTESFGCIKLSYSTLDNKKTHIFVNHSLIE